MVGVICPVCQERSEKDSGFGKGIYLINDVLNNPQLQPALHPFCQCYFTAVEDNDDDDNKKKKIGVAGIMENNVSKWAAGAGISILGTALMYAIFRRTRKNIIIPEVSREVIQPVKEQIPEILNIQPVNRTKPKAITQGFDVLDAEVIEPTVSTSSYPKILKPSRNNLPDNVLDLINQNRKKLINDIPEILQQEQVSSTPLVLPMLDLKIPEKIIKGQLVGQVSKEINDAIDKQQNFGSGITTFSYGQVIDSSVNEAKALINVVNETNPNSLNNSVTKRLDRIINSNIPDYLKYNSQTYNKDVSQLIVKKYGEDIQYINNLIDKLQNNNLDIYAGIRSLIKTRDDIVNNISLQLPNVTEEIINSHPKIVELNNTLVDLNNSLITNQQRLQENDLFGLLNSTKERILSNPDITNDYLKFNGDKINRIFNNLGKSDPALIYTLDKQLDGLINTVNNLERLSKIELINYLDELEYSYKKLSKEKDKVKGLLDVDLKDYISKVSKGGRTRDNDRLYKASGILSYKEGIAVLENKILYITTLLLNKYA